MSHTLKSISASTVTLADVEADGVVMEIEQNSYRYVMLKSCWASSYMSANSDLYLPGVKDQSSGGGWLLMMLHHAVVSFHQAQTTKPWDFLWDGCNNKNKIKIQQTFPSLQVWGLGFWGGWGEGDGFCIICA